MDDIAISLKLDRSKPMDANTEAYDYAVRLAVELAERHQAAARFEPLPDLLGVLTQIDHLTVGLVPQRARGIGFGES